jgi:serine protease Do
MRLTRVSLTLLLGALPGLTPTPVTAQAPASPAVPTDPHGALPESYPWVRLAEQLMPAVVNVRTVAEAQRSRGPAIPEPFRRFFPPQDPGGREQRRGVGTGFLVDPDGLLVTNHHVVDGATSIEVTLSDGRKFPAKVMGSDPETDVALLKIEATGMPTIPLGSSAKLKVAEPVMAIGNPFGLDHTVTVGIISGTGRFIGAGRYDDYIQTDAAINPGNSGGPLINTRGEVVGINSAIASRSGGFQGVGFAIPIDLAKPILQQLRVSGKVTRGWLGVSIQPLTPDLAKSFGLTVTQGALVSSVVEESPAAKAGVRPGDVIVQFDGKPIDGPRALPPLVALTEVGRTVSMTVLRDGAEQTLRLTVGNLSDSQVARASTGDRLMAERLGIGLQELTPELARRLGVKDDNGVVVTEVKPDSPAAQAGLASGDVIREVNRLPVRALEDVEKGMSRGGAEAKQVLLRVEREGNQRYVVVDLG